MKMYVTLSLFFCMYNIIRAAPAPLSNKRDTTSIYDGCGTKKSCFGIQAGCIENKNCLAITTVFKDDNGRYIFEMESKNAGWVGVGLSDDNKMGDDSVIECAKENGEARAFMAWTTPRPNLGSYRVPDAQDKIELLDGSTEDKTLYCKVRRDTVTTINNKVFDLENDSYYLLLAAGTNVGAYHDIARGSTSNKAKLASVGAFQN